ncbi:hypothetical protein IGJ51_001514 [Enterococcus sp. DIV0802c]
MINKFHKIPDILKLKFIGSVFLWNGGICGYRL